MTIRQTSTQTLLLSAYYRNPLNTGFNYGKKRFTTF